MTSENPMEPWDEHNKELINQVHPLDWVNPIPAGRYNLVVIGGGTAGLVCAAGAAGLGAKVALVERALLGGDCLNHGCVPSKALLRAARAAAEARRAGDFGIDVTGISVDFPAVMERVRRVRAQMSRHDSANRFKELGVDVYLGEASFKNAHTITAGGRELVFSKAVIASGARAWLPPVPGLDTAPVYTNETIFSLTALPERLLVLGGGPIGCELAQAFQRLGSRVTLVEKGPQLLSKEDPHIAATLRIALERDGVTVLTGAEAEAVRRMDGTPVMTVKRDGGLEQIEFDALLIGAGRVPNVEAMDLEAAGINFDKRGVLVDDFMRTSNRRVFACGDVCQQYKFTHAADAAARIVIRNALFPFLPKSRVSSLVMPWVTYTDPEVAHVGITENEARESGVSLETVTIPLADVDRAVLDGETEGLLTIHLAAGSDRILGASYVAAHAGESIVELVLAMQKKIGLGGLSNVIHPYPTQAEAVRKAGDAQARKRLTPFVRGILGGILAWQR